jgi:asparagine synthetase B (glutamine-hydrolysing)
VSHPRLAAVRAAPREATAHSTIETKAAALDTRLRSLGSLIIAYSGGVDSAYLAVSATRVLGHRALCVTADSASYPDRHRELALGTARAFSLRHEIIETDELSRPEYRANPANRGRRRRQQRGRSRRLPTRPPGGARARRRQPPR